MPSFKSFISLGSNINPVQNILAMMKALKNHPKLQITKISSLYETTPHGAGTIDSPNFLNVVVQLETDLDPHSLLGALQKIENDCQRQRIESNRNAPRTADLDILLYAPNLITTTTKPQYFAKKYAINTPMLTIPHPRMWERDFVMTPLLEVVDENEKSIITSRYRKEEKQRVLLTAAAGGDSLELSPKKNIVDARCLYGSLLVNKKKTIISGIVNATPDSFSDGGQDPIQLVDKLISQGAHSLDIGGESTRPGAKPITAQEEIDRVLPVIEYCHKNFPHIPLSIDTTKSVVAKHAIQAGVEIVNDVSGLRFDPEMIHVVAKSGVGLVLVHSVGDNLESMHNNSSNSSSTSSINRYGYVLIDDKYTNKCLECVSNGIPPWQITLDPGIGFGKTMEENAELLDFPFGFRLAELSLEKMSVMIGASRKRILKHISNGNDNYLDKHDWLQVRDIATAASTAIAVYAGADVIRVHDVVGNTIAARIAEKIRRSKWGY
jgi:2-amino-4-hydroxy-6-hydroxymethyldihydropteridine diphosphokinase/dihydropteroate synthase